MGHYEVAQMVRRKYGDRVRGLLWARVWQVGSGTSFHVEVRRRWQLEDRQNASDVEKGAPRRTMRSFLRHEFETRSHARSLAATRRGFTFYACHDVAPGGGGS